MTLKENNTLVADEGKALRRISDGIIFGKEMRLGYTYYINGNLLEEPHLEVPEDFDEIDYSYDNELDEEIDE